LKRYVTYLNEFTSRWPDGWSDPNIMPA